MIHLRTDSYDSNNKRKFACGRGPDLPESDKWIYLAEGSLHRLVDCPGCKLQTQSFGTPISELSGRPGHKGYDKFVEISNSWGYD